MTAQNASGTWRCGSSYVDQPCADGNAIKAADPRSVDDRRAQDAATRRARATADALERERLQREAQARRDGRPIVIGKPSAASPSPGIPASQPRKGKVRKSGKAPEYFTARDPQVASDKRKGTGGR